MTETLPILYSFRRCPYAMRARMAIAASGQSVRLREVVLRDKPQAMLDASPKGTVPVLVLSDGRVIEESIDVMMWALSSADPDHWLAHLETDGGDTRALIAETDGPFKQNLDRYKYATRYEGADPLVHRADGMAFIEKLERRLADQPYLCGNRFSLADAAIAPFIRQFANADKDWFETTPVPNVRRWLDEVLTSDRFTRVMGKYAAWAPGMEEPLFPAKK